MAYRDDWDYQKMEGALILRGVCPECGDQLEVEVREVTTTVRCLGTHRTSDGTEYPCRAWVGASFVVDVTWG